MVVATDILLWHEEVDFVLFVQLNAFGFLAEFIIAFRVNSIVVLSAEELVSIVVPNFGSGVELA